MASGAQGRLSLAHSPQSGCDIDHSHWLMMLIIRRNRRGPIAGRRTRGWTHGHRPRFPGSTTYKSICLLEDLPAALSRARSTVERVECWSLEFVKHRQHSEQKDVATLKCLTSSCYEPSTSSNILITRPLHPPPPPPPPSSLSLPALLSSWPRPTLPFAAAESHSAASLTSSILLPLPARTVSVGFTLPTLNSLTTSPATGAPQTIEEFDADCATLGVTAQCCLLLVSLYYRFRR